MSHIKPTVSGLVSKPLHQCSKALVGIFLSAVLGSSAFAVVSSAKVGVILPLTGQTANFGQDSLNGLKLALEKNQSLPKIELVVEDTLGTPTGAASAVNKLIATDKVNVIIGEVASSNTIAASAPAQSNKVPLLTHASTNDTITKGKDFVSRICFIDSFQGQVMAKFASNDLAAKTAVILVDSDSDYSRGLRDSFKAAFVATGGKIVDEISYSQKDTDFKSQLMKVRKAKSDVVFVPGYYTQVGSILRQSAELKISSKYLGTDGWSGDDLFKIAGKAAAGHYVSNHFVADDKDPKVQAFVAEYKAKYGKVPSDMAALGYDAANFVKNAIRVAGSVDSSKIRDAINATKNFEGITGNISLDANRNAIKSAVITRTTETGFVFHSRVNP
jgi:branched-chain amino acid transport system substrate-binding protein